MIAPSKISMVIRHALLTNGYFRSKSNNFEECWLYVPVAIRIEECPFMDVVEISFESPLRAKTLKITFQVTQDNLQEMICLIGLPALDLDAYIVAMSRISA